MAVIHVRKGKSIQIFKKDNVIYPRQVYNLLTPVYIRVKKTLFDYLVEFFERIL